MTQWRLVQLVSTRRPVRHRVSQQSIEALRVIPLQQVNHLVNDDIFKAKGMSSREFQIQANVAGVAVARSSAVAAERGSG